MTPPAIEAEEIGFAYGETVALSDVSMTVPTGSVTALLGPNGAGKTTFVRLVTGVLEPDTGRLSVFDDAPGSLDRERLGVLPQAFDPPGRVTPREVLHYYGGLYARSRDPGVLIDELGLAAVADRRYHRLSGGEQRRTCLAIALISDPELLVLDEPTAEIDPAGKRAVWSVLPELLDDGTLLLTTHDMHEAERLADRVAFFHEGGLVAAGAAESVIADHLGSHRLVVATDTPELLQHHLDRGQVTDDGLVIDGIGADALPEVVQAVVAAEGSVSGIHWQRPPLEDLFLALSEEDERS